MIFLTNLFFIVFIATNNVSTANQPLNIADSIISKCNNGPRVALPGEDKGKIIKVAVVIVPLRFIGIFDVSETFTIAASVSLIWSDECTTNALESEELKNVNMSTFYFEKDTFWSPKLIHMNSKVYKSTKSDDFEQGIRLYRGGVYGKLAKYNAYIYGVFESHCDLDMKTFPFDK